MNNKKIIYALLTSLSVMILIGVILSILFLCEACKDEIIYVDLSSGINSERVKFEDVALVPGEETGYTVRFLSDVSDEYDVSFTFSDGTDGTLNEHLCVKMELGGEILCDKPLNELIEEGPYKTVLSLTRNKYSDVIVTYYMPSETGNEAQSATGEFELFITASNAEDFYE